MYTLFKGSIKTRLDRSSHTVVTSLSLLSLGIWKTCLSFFLLSLWNGALLIRNVMGHLFSFLPRLVAVFYLFFNVGPCFADVLFEIKAYSLSLFLSLFYPQLRRGSCYESHKQRALFACHQALRRIPFHHVKYSPYLLFLVVLLKNSFQIAVSDSLLFRRRGDDRGQGGDDLRVALMK